MTLTESHSVAVTAASSLSLAYYRDKVKIINPTGYIGILTLWSRVDNIINKLGELPPSIAAISNFYGDGLSQLIANLLLNPQIQYLYVFGADRTTSYQELVAFFKLGIEEINIHNSKHYRVKTTTRLVNSAITGPAMFMGDLPEIIKFDSIEAIKEAMVTTKHKVRQISRQPVEVHLIESLPTFTPNLHHSHQIIGDNLLDAWAELLFAISRYGEQVQLAKGARRELYNVKVVYECPKLDVDAYKSYNLNKSMLDNYATTLLCDDLPSDISYTYGNRLLNHFGFDAIQRVVNRLVADQNDRKSFISLWDQRDDLVPAQWSANKSAPCWVTAYFRIIDGKLSLSATFRTHRAYTAWVENAYGLQFITTYMALSISNELGSSVGVGPITIYSQSISIDPTQLPLVDSVLAGRKWRMRDDQRGDIVFSIDNNKIVAEHKYGGLTIKKYESHSAEVITHEMAQDQLLSDLGHSLYVGRMLGKLQMCIKYNLPFEET